MSAEPEPIPTPAPEQKPPPRRESEELLNQRMTDWLVWKVALPLVIFFVIWTAYKWVCGMDHPFERAFAHGDLLIFSALVLIEAVVEGEHQHGQSNLKRTGLQLAKVVAISFIMIFGFIKYDVIVMEKKAQDAQVAAAKAAAQTETADSESGGEEREPRVGVQHGAVLVMGQREAAPREEVRVKEHDDLMSKMLLYSYLNCVIAVVSVVFSVFAFWSSVSAEKNRQYDVLKGGQPT